MARQLQNLGGTSEHLHVARFVVVTRMCQVMPRVVETTKYGHKTFQVADASSSLR